MANGRRMTSAGEEIRAATARNELHPLVRDNYASPRGFCNAHAYDDAGEKLYFCTLDYEHQGDHANGAVRWSAPWPPAEPER